VIVTLSTSEIISRAKFPCRSIYVTFFLMMAMYGILALSITGILLGILGIGSNYFQVFTLLFIIDPLLLSLVKSSIGYKVEKCLKKHNRIIINGAEYIFRLQ